MVNSEKPVEPFTAMDSKPLSRAHLKIWFTAGMGFFTNAYDLFIIGVALLIFGAYNIPGFTLHSTIFGQAVAGFIGSSAIFAAVFGQLLFGFLGDRLGRKITQLQGFVAMAFLYAAVSYFALTKGTSITGFLIPSSFALALYALTFFFIDFGPYTTTFVVPAEVYPTKHRTTGHGISAAAGKLGAALTTFYFPALLLNIGVKGILEMLAVVSIVGALLTLGLKEPNKLTLEQVAREELVREDEVKAIN
jgi:PHS family inorganic phosphate transporter-like MFS transporter